MLKNTWSIDTNTRILLLCMSIDAPELPVDIQWSNSERREMTMVTGGCRNGDTGNALQGYLLCDYHPARNELYVWPAPYTPRQRTIANEI